MSPRPGRRRLLALAAAAVLPFAAASPASAQSSLTVEITAPGDGAAIAGTFTPEITGKVYTGVGVNLDVVRVVVARHSDGATVVDTTVCCDNPRNGTVPFSLTAPALSRNGPYTVRVAAAGHFLVGGLAVSPSHADRTFAMAVPPAAPILAEPQVSDGTVRLTWTPGRADPDLMGYAVYRRVGQGSFQPLAGVGATVTTYTDERPPAAGGAVQYRVDALRQGATISNNANDWLSRSSAPVVANLPVPPTTSPPSTLPGETTTSTTPGGGLQRDGAISSTSDLSSLFGSGTASVPTFPAPAIPEIPDPGFSELLPFPGASAGNRVDGRQPGTLGETSGRAALDLDEVGGDLDESNRRALLIPVAGGSVLCVTALHLRWLNRRLAAAGAAAAASAGAPGELAGLEPAEPDPEAFRPGREPVGAGSPGGTGPRA